jgi:hypothetical protein
LLTKKRTKKICPLCIFDLKLNLLPANRSRVRC